MKHITGLYETCPNRKILFLLLYCSRGGTMHNCFKYEPRYRHSSGTCKFHTSKTSVLHTFHIPPTRHGCWTYLGTIPLHFSKADLRCSPQEDVGLTRNTNVPGHWRQIPNIPTKMKTGRALLVDVLKHPSTLNVILLRPDLLIWVTYGGIGFMKGKASNCFCSQSKLTYCLTLRRTHANSVQPLSTVDSLSKLHKNSANGFYISRNVERWWHVSSLLTF
jgi:hypothetical protein